MYGLDTVTLTKVRRMGTPYGDDNESAYVEFEVPVGHQGGNVQQIVAKKKGQGKKPLHRGKN